MRTLVLVLVAALLVASPAAFAKPPAETPSKTRAKTEATKARRQLLGRLIRLTLEQLHLTARPVDDKVSAVAYDELLERLDPGRYFLLTGDVESLAKNRTLLDDELRTGAFTVADDTRAIMVRRVKVVASVVDKILANPIALAGAGRFETDPEKRGWADTETALKQRWESRLRLAIFSTLATEEEKAEKAEDKKPLEPVAAREKDARERLRKRYKARFGRMQKTTAADHLEYLINALNGAYDPHTRWLPPKEKQDFDIRFRGKLEGIGALLREQEDYIKVERVMPGGAAWRDGRLRAGDLILSVGQGEETPVDIAGMRIQDAVQLIRGKRDTVVKLTVKKSDGAEAVIDIVRAVVKIEGTFAKGAVIQRKKDSPRVGYIYLPSFYGGFQADARMCGSDIRRLLDRMNAHKADAVILDLRGNGGGLLSEAVDIAGQFIEDGPIVQVRTSSGERMVHGDRDPRIVFKGPVVVMVDRFSASASEIVAAALQDHRRAIVVGTSATHGKGTVQTFKALDELIFGTPQSTKLPDLGVVKVTVQQFYRVNGVSTQRIGATPDILLPDPYAHVESGERFYDRAIPEGKIAEALFEVWPQAPPIDRLRPASEKRQAKSAAFSRVRKRSMILVAGKTDTKAALDFTTWTAERHERRNVLEKLDDPKDAAAFFDATPVVYDEKRGQRVPQETVTERWKWAEGLERDPFLDESLHILEDLLAL